MNAERQFKLWQDDFDDGYLSFEYFEQIFALGRKSGLEEAAEIASEWSAYVEVDTAPITCRDAIRQRIEETP